MNENRLPSLGLEFAVLTWGPKASSVFNGGEPDSYTTSSIFPAAALKEHQKIAETMALQSLRSSICLCSCKWTKYPRPLKVTQTFSFVKSTSVWPKEETNPDGKTFWFFFGIHGPSWLCLRQWATGDTGDESKTVLISLVETRVFLDSVITFKIPISKERN